jgi:predicted nucleic acid-binding Zn ribbon protein
MRFCFLMFFMLFCFSMLSFIFIPHIMQQVGTLRIVVIMNGENNVWKEWLFICWLISVEISMNEQLSCHHCKEKEKRFQKSLLILFFFFLLLFFYLCELYNHPSLTFINARCKYLFCLYIYIYMYNLVMVLCITRIIFVLWIDSLIPKFK